MSRLTPVIACLFLASTTWPVPAEAATNADIVNERPSASLLEREAHWGVDCAAGWAELHLALDQPDPHCALAPELLESLRLCSYIYQPPGGPESTSNCRDFGGLLQKRDQSCAEIGAWLDSRPVCSEGP